MSISDFDNYVPLSSRGGVIKAWFTYIYSHGYMQLPGIVLVVGYMVWMVIRQYRNRDDSKLARFNIGVLLSFVLNAAYYTITVTRVSVYYYYIPLCLLTVAFLINICVGDGRRLKYISAAVILISLLPSTVHVWDIYSEQRAGGDRIETVSYRYDDFVNWLRSRRYPYSSLMVPTSMPLDMSSGDLNWIPQADTLSAEKRVRIGVEGGYMNSWRYYWTFEDVWTMNPGSVMDVDIFAVSKMNAGDYSTIDAIMRGAGKKVIYNDNFVIAYGSAGLSEKNPTLDEEIQAAANVQPPLPLDPVWNGTTIVFAEPTDCSGYDVIEFSFDLTNAEKVSELRLVFNGSRMDRIENAWHYIVRKGLQNGHNSFTLEKEDFVLSTGYIDWSNVTNIGIGGIGSSDSVITDIEIRLK